MSDVLLNALTVVAALLLGVVVIDLFLMYVIWRAKGISRAQDLRRRKKMAKARAEREQRQLKDRLSRGYIPSDAPTVVLPKQRVEQEMRFQRNVIR